MADEKDKEAAPAAAGSDGGGDCPPVPKCPDCVPGLPGWMATFSDMVTLLLTFFVLLLSFAKTETAKYESALGSIREAFGGNGVVFQPGKSADNAPVMTDSSDPIKPFPIEFLTTEGLLDKQEINRESTETLKDMKNVLKEYQLTDNAAVYEVPEGIKVKIKDKIYFKEGSVVVDNLARVVLDRMLELLRKKDWTLFIEGHASRGEVSSDGNLDAFGLSSKRAEVVAKTFIKNGVSPDKITVVYYGDNRPDGDEGVKIEGQARNRRVEFILRKTDLRTEGHQVQAE